MEEERVFELSWTNEDNIDKERNDDILFFALLRYNEFFELHECQAKRGDKKCLIDISSIHDIGSYLYVFFAQKDKKAFSDSRAISYL
jgi:hypothetical protein